ncbi:hypothetical protein F4777DRAFT_559135 [Nemania sp. FL0916]|nr:hypothetical protein F4777DRAFT_559135 [Nemania sp. FL0916]
MAPSTATVRSLLQRATGDIQASGANSGSLLQLGGLVDILAPNVQVEIVGFNITINGAAAVKNPSSDIPSLASVIQVDKPIHADVTHVLADNDVIVAITRSKATTHSNIPWDHETVTVLHFDSNDQVDSVRVYNDTHALNQHISAAV